jgi:squalene-hopene/tetraprenyl-beta-curcumene cyclase
MRIPSLLAVVFCLPTLAWAGAHSAGNDVSHTAQHSSWDRAAAAKYLDERQAWWLEWPHAQKDHGTVCVSCHTQVPYALARPALRMALGETHLSDPEQAMLKSIETRVELGKVAVTFYSDAEHGPGKTQEARNAEAVNNALILSAYDAARAKADAASGVIYRANSERTMPQLHRDSLAAFAMMWSLQEQSGEKAGAWIWQNFHFSPWEAPESEYWGAAMAAIAVGTAPDHYAENAAIQPNLTLLRGYLRREAASQPLLNRIQLLWASARLSGLMSKDEQAALVKEIYAKQRDDGGWCLTDLGLMRDGTTAWKRHDKTPFPAKSDGYATGLIVLALEENHLEKTAEARRGLAWIEANQSKVDGRWQAWSVNVERKPESDVGKFMSDAATGFAVLALEESKH